MQSTESFRARTNIDQRSQNFNEAEYDYANLRIVNRPKFYRGSTDLIGTELQFVISRLAKNTFKWELHS